MTARTTETADGASVVEEASKNNDLVFDRKLDLATAGLHPYVRKHLVTNIPHDNAATIVDYMLAKNSEISLSDNYRRDNILTLKKLAELIKNKPSKDMQCQDVITFLDQRDILQNKKEKSELIY